MFAVARMRGLGQTGWLLAISGLVLGFLLHGTLYPTVISMCGPSDYENIMNSRINIAMVADGLILVRIIIGLCRNEKGLGWIFYGVLPSLLVPLIAIAIKIRYAGYHGCSGC
jgi:hypothetical protein